MTPNMQDVKRFMLAPSGRGTVAYLACGHQKYIVGGKPLGGRVWRERCWECDKLDRARHTEARCTACPIGGCNLPGTTWLLSADNSWLNGPFCAYHADTESLRVRKERGEYLQKVLDPEVLPDTRYPVSWWSESKGRMVTLESMQTEHLRNAYNKLGNVLNRIGEGDKRLTDPTACFMAEELKRRGVEPAGPAPLSGTSGKAAPAADREAGSTDDEHEPDCHCQQCDLDARIAEEDASYERQREAKWGL